MGKSGKHRKRVRLLREYERGAAVTTNAASSASGTGQGGGGSALGGDEDYEEEEEALPGGISPEDLATTVSTLHTISKGEKKKPSPHSNQNVCRSALTYRDTIAAWRQ